MAKEFKVTVWWTLQQGFNVSVEAESPEEAISKAQERLSQEEELYHLSEIFENSEGPENFEVVGSAGGVLAEKFSQQQVLHDASDDLYQALKDLELGYSTLYRAVYGDARAEDIDEKNPVMKARSVLAALEEKGVV